MVEVSLRPLEGEGDALSEWVVSKEVSKKSRNRTLLSFSRVSE